MNLQTIDHIYDGLDVINGYNLYLDNSLISILNYINQVSEVFPAKYV